MLAPVIPENDEAYIDLFWRFDGRTSAHIGFRDVIPEWEEGKGPPWLRNDQFQLDEGNNWWLKQNENGKYQLHYRYGQADMLQRLQPFLNWIFK